MSRQQLETVRAIGVGAFAGGICGALIGGLGGRIAMRISGHLTDPGVTLRTANGNVLGEITLDGTLGLVIFSGIAPGIIAGVLYALLRPSLERVRRRGLVFGLGLLAVGGPFAIEPFNVDFDRFGILWLNVLMFAALFVLLGLAVASFYELVERNSRGASSMGEVQKLAVLVWLSVPAAVLMAVLIIVVGIANLATLVSLGTLPEAELVTVMFGAAMLATIALAVARLRWPRLVGLATVALLAVVAWSAIHTITAIVLTLS